MKDVIRRIALLNAVEYQGKANVSAVLGKIISEKPELKSDIKEIIKEIQTIVKEINSIPLSKQKKEIEKLGLKIENKKIEEKKGLPDLEDAVMGKVITVFPPEPSKYPHLGHAKAALLNFLFAKKYRGKFVLRFEDTNPEIEKEEYYKSISEGLKWLGIKWDSVEYASDFIEKFYQTTEKLISDGKAYVCLCPQEKTKKLRAEKEECEHRSQNAQKNLELWKKMLSSMKEGEATVRLKIDMSHANTTLRDPSIMRIIDKNHPRNGNKFRVWPMYDYATAMMDGWGEITHRVRSKEFEIRKDLQRYIQKLEGLKAPKFIEIGRFNLEGVPSSGRQIRELIKTGELKGWDDPRLTTLIALKRRGFDPEALKEFILSTGLTKAEGILSWDAIEAENRKIIDSQANRYFAVFDPVEISVDKAPQTKFVEAQLHPNFKDRGIRKIAIDNKKIFIEREDFEKLKGKEVGLINLYTVKLKKKSEFVSKNIKMEDKKIQWVSEPNVKIKVVMDDGRIIDGMAEESIRFIMINQLIQLIRFGFCRVDKVNKDILLYYAHK